MKWICLPRGIRGAAAALAVTVALSLLGCFRTRPDLTPLGQGPAPRRMPSPARQAEASCSYEDSLTGGQVFSMYCSQCHNSRPLSERPFAHYQNVAAHMRVRANLTGKEYAKLMEFLRRWHDIPAPTPSDAASPKRFTFGQPIAELRNQTTAPQPPGNPGLPPNDVGRTPAPSRQQPSDIVPAAASTTDHSELP